MKNRRVHRRLAATALAGTLVVSAGTACASTTDYIDLEAGLGFSSNPGLSLDSRSSAFGRISANGVHSWTSEHGSTSLSAYIENSTYLRGYGSRQIFSLGAQTSQQVSSTVSIYGSLGFSGDFGGQLSNRLISVPNQPVVIDPANPLPPLTTAPDLLGLSGRQYRLSGDVGASIKSGAKSSINLTVGADRSLFTGQYKDANFTSVYASAGYSQQVSERTSVGAAVYVQRQDFTHCDWANAINPSLTGHTQLSESLVADAAVGVMVIEQQTEGQKSHSVSPSFSGSLCSNGTISRICARVSRDARSALSSRITNVGAETTITTTASLDYFRKLSPEGTLQASLLAANYETPAAFQGDKVRTTYVSAVVGYDRKVGNRIYAGIQGGVRKLFQSGPDPKLDLNANVYLRYRLGDLL